MKAIRITSQTLIGFPDKRPAESGNCFSIEADDGHGYRIVNFNLENLEALIKLGLTYPIECKQLAGGIAIIHDPRIGERWYRNRFCEVCCPEKLLPITQLHRHERDVMRGRRTEKERYVRYDFDIKAKFE